MVVVLASPVVQPSMGETESTVDYGEPPNVRFGSEAAGQDRLRRGPTAESAKGLLSAKSSRLDHQLEEGSMASIRFTLSKSPDQSCTKSSAVSH